MRGVFFYSTECPNCSTMWKIMEQENFLQYFEKINIDKITLEQLQNLGITKVPALLLTFPNGSKVLREAEGSFAWLRELIQNRRNSMSQMINSNRLKILEKNKELNNNGGILEFSKTEMQGLSDDYAYLQSDVAQTKNFLLYGNDASQAILTFAEGTKMTQNDTKNKITEIESIRNQQNEVIKKDMRVGQMEAVYDNKMIR
jgi:hypothetical protein